MKRQNTPSFFKTILKPCALFFSLTLLASPAFGAKSGAALGLAWDYGFGIAGQLDGKINLHLGNNGFGADYIFVQRSIKTSVPLSWYIAAGAGLNRPFDDNEYNTAVKIRGLAGLDLDFAPNFDAFVAIGPDMKLYTRDQNDQIRFGLDALIGLRYHF